MIVGIDLGTTHSLVGAFIDGQSRLFANAHGHVLTPSAVSVGDDGTLLIGRPALDRVISHPDASVASFKRWMGTRRETRLGKRAYLPEELSALVIRSLLDDVEAACGSRPDEAVISVPAYFSDAQRRATRRAGELAGVRVERLINEPTAAALAYGLAERLDDAHVLVLDLGGGTFDVSILELFDGVVKVHASAGDNFLGGDDFTHALRDHVLASHKVDAESLSAAERAMLWMRAEHAKRELSNGRAARIALSLAGHDVATDLDESQFEALVAPLIQRLRTPIERAMRDAGLRGADLAEVVMVGGASRMPLLSRIAARLLGRLPLRHVAPDEAVAQGACVAAALKARDAAFEEIVLTDVCPHSLGVEISMNLGPGQRSDGHFDPIIERNSTVPVSRMREYFPVHPQQTQVTLGVYQGEHPRADQNIALGQLEIPVPPGPPDERGIDVRFTYDINGVLQVEATVQKSGIRRELLLIQDGSDLTEAEAKKRLDELAALKVHPREEQPNIAAVARVERLYAESLGDMRAQLQHWLVQFQSVLATQDRAQIDEHRTALLSALDGLEAGPLA
ncbi:Hsp70 family protein [Cognatilysobacter bugurensis]|nr:Hsp70 family protein [Lysobacter bugurensis]